MAPDSVSAVGGASVPSEIATPVTAQQPAAPKAAPADGGGAFGEALKVARGVAAAPARPVAPSAAAQARAKELGLPEGVGASDVLGHRYARIEAGERDGHFVNTSGNARNGQTFEVVRRDGHVYHVYADRAFRVRSEEAAPAGDAATGGSAAAQGA
jgi:hypothetical protein